MATKEGEAFSHRWKARKLERENAHNQGRSEKKPLAFKPASVPAR